MIGTADMPATEPKFFVPATLPHRPLTALSPSSHLSTIHLFSKFLGHKTACFYVFVASKAQNLVRLRSCFYVL